MYFYIHNCLCHDHKITYEKHKEIMRVNLHSFVAQKEIQFNEYKCEFVKDKKRTAFVFLLFFFLHFLPVDRGNFVILAKKVSDS